MTVSVWYYIKAFAKESCEEPALVLADSTFDLAWLIYAPYVIYAHGIFYNELQQWKLLASWCPTSLYYVEEFILTIVIAVFDQYNLTDQLITL